MSETKNNTAENPKQIIIVNESEDERLLRDMNRSDMEKLKLFMQMLRTNRMLKQAKITHKKIDDQTQS